MLNKKNLKKLSLLTFINFITIGCTEKNIHIPYDKKIIEECSIKKLETYKELNKILPQKESLKNVIFNTNQLKIRYSKNFKEQEDIELYTFNDKYTIKENSCNSSDIRLENYYKINEIFKEQINMSFNEWAKKYNEYYENIKNDYKEMIEYQNEYMNNLMNTNINDKKVMHIIVNNNTGEELNFDINELEIAWKDIENEDNLKEDFYKNLKLIGIQQLYSVEYILNNVFLNCEFTEDNNCLKQLKKYEIEANNIIRENKNKLIKFSNLLKADMNKYKTYPHITSIFGDNILSGEYKGKDIKLNIKKNNIVINIYNSILSNTVPYYFSAQDMNLKILIKKDKLILKNLSTSTITIDTLKIRNMNKYYYIDVKKEIPFKTQLTINLKKYKKYQSSKYYKFKGYEKEITNIYGIYVEYMKPIYKMPKILEKNNTFIVKSKIKGINVYEKNLYKKNVIQLVSE